MKHKTPSRRRYEAANPCVSIRLPATVRDLAVGEAYAAGVTLSAWVADAIRRKVTAPRPAAAADTLPRAGDLAGLQRQTSGSEGSEMDQVDYSER